VHLLYVTCTFYTSRAPFICHVHLYTSRAPLYLTCTFYTSHAPLYLTCTFIPHVHLYTSRAPLYLTCTFITHVHLYTSRAPLYLTCTSYTSRAPFKPHVHVLYLTCTFYTSRAPLYLTCTFYVTCTFYTPRAPLYVTCTFSRSTLRLIQDQLKAAQVKEVCLCFQVNGARKRSGVSPRSCTRWRARRRARPSRGACPGPRSPTRSARAQRNNVAPSG